MWWHRVFISVCHNHDTDDRDVFKWVPTIYTAVAKSALMREVTMDGDRIVQYQMHLILTL